MTKTIDGREVIVAIIGGTMLTLALTRPQLKWVSRMPRSGKSQRLWAERAITGFSFAMGGYATASVWLALYGQLGSETDSLLRGTAGFLAAYAGLVHFEPFVNEWRLRTGLGAFALYVGFALLAFTIGDLVAELMLTSSISMGGVRLLTLTTGTAGAGWVFYRKSAKLDAALDRWTDSAAEWLLRRTGRLPRTNDRNPS